MELDAGFSRQIVIAIQKQPLKLDFDPNNAGNKI